MYLYHVTPVIEQSKRKRFIPRVPESVGKDENNSIPRICLSDSITLAVQASPYVSEMLQIGKRIRVYKIRVDARNISKFVHYTTLFNKELVPDALENHEYWCTSEITMDSDVYTVEDARIDFDIAWTVISKQQVLNILAYLNNKSHGNLDYVWIDNNLKTSKELYESIVIQMDKHGDYDSEDDMWDCIAELPWAQIKRITKFTIKKLS